PLTDRDVDRADAATDRRGERTLDADLVLLDGVEGLLREPDDLAVHVVGLVAGIHLHPGDPATVAVRVLYRRVQDPLRGRPDVGPRPITLDEADDGLVGDGQGPVVVDRDLVATVGHLDLVVGHGS